MGHSRAYRFYATDKSTTNQSDKKVSRWPFQRKPKEHENIAKTLNLHLPHLSPEVLKATLNAKENKRKSSVFSANLKWTLAVVGILLTLWAVPLPEWLTGPIERILVRIGVSQVDIDAARAAALAIHGDPHSKQTETELHEKRGGGTLAQRARLAYTRLWLKVLAAVAHRSNVGDACADLGGVPTLLASASVGVHDEAVRLAALRAAVKMAQCSAQWRSAIADETNGWSDTLLRLCDSDASAAARHEVAGMLLAMSSGDTVSRRAFFARTGLDCHRRLLTARPNVPRFVDTRHLLGLSVGALCEADQCALCDQLLDDDDLLGVLRLLVDGVRRASTLGDAAVVPMRYLYVSSERLTTAQLFEPVARSLGAVTRPRGNDAEARANTQRWRRRIIEQGWLELVAQWCGANASASLAERSLQLASVRVFEHVTEDDETAALVLQRVGVERLVAVMAEVRDLDVHGRIDRLFRHLGRHRTPDKRLASVIDSREWWLDEVTSIVDEFSLFCQF